MAGLSQWVRYILGAPYERPQPSDGLRYLNCGIDRCFANRYSHGNGCPQLHCPLGACTLFEKAQVAPILDFIFPAVGCGLTFGSLNNGKCKLWIGITFSLAIAVTLVALEMYYPHFLHFDLWWLSLDSTDALRLELNMGVWSAVAAFVPVFAYYKRNINVGK